MSNNNSTSPLDIPLPGEDMLEFYMNRAYARAAPAPAATELSYDEKYKLMLLNAKSEMHLHNLNEETEHYIRTAQAQLAKPCVPPSKLTSLEQCEEDRTKTKQDITNLRNKLIDSKLTQNDQLCEDVLTLIDTAEPKKPIDFQSRIPVRAQTVISSPSPRPSQIPRLVDLESCSPAFSKGKNFFAGLDKSRK